MLDRKKLSREIGKAFQGELKVFETRAAEVKAGKLSAEGWASEAEAMIAANETNVQNLKLAAKEMRARGDVAAADQAEAAARQGEDAVAKMKDMAPQTGPATSRALSAAPGPNAQPPSDAAALPLGRFPSALAKHRAAAQGLEVAEGAVKASEAALAKAKAEGRPTEQRQRDYNTAVRHRDEARDRLKVADSELLDAVKNPERTPGTPQAVRDATGGAAAPAHHVDPLGDTHAAPAGPAESPAPPTPAAPTPARVRLTGANGNMTRSDAAARVVIHESGLRLAQDNLAQAVAKGAPPSEIANLNFAVRYADLQLRLTRAISGGADQNTFTNLMKEEADLITSRGFRGPSPGEIEQDAERLFKIAHGAPVNTPAPPAPRPTPGSPSPAEIPTTAKGAAPPRAAQPQTPPAPAAGAQRRARLTGANGSVTPSQAAGRLKMHENALESDNASLQQAIQNGDPGQIRTWRLKVRETELQLRLTRAISGGADRNTFLQLMREEADFYASLGDPAPSAAEIERDADRLYNTSRAAASAR